MDPRDLGLAVRAAPGRLWQWAQEQDRLRMEQDAQERARMGRELSMMGGALGEFAGGLAGEAAPPPELAGPPTSSIQVPQTRITGMYHDSTMAPSAYDISETMQDTIGIPDTTGSAGPAPSRLAQDAGGGELVGPPAPRQFGLPRDEGFEDVIGGVGRMAPGAHATVEAPRSPSHLKVGIGDNWQDAQAEGFLAQPLNLAAAPGATAWDPADNRTEAISAPAGGGTYSMMTAPENEQDVTFASDLQRAQQQSALRQARGEPSPADIFRAETQQALRFGPVEQLKFAEQEATNAEIMQLVKYQQELQQAVEVGRLPQEEAQRLFEDARGQAAFRIQALRGGSLGAWGPNRNDVFGDLGAMPPAPPAG